MKPYPLLAGLAVLTAVVILPAIVNPLYITIFLGFAIFSVFALSLNLLLSFTGLLSFGHAMFFAAGAYGTALGLFHLEGLPLLAAVGFGGLSAVGLALVLSPVLARAGGHTFAMLTMAFSQILYAILMKFTHISGGNDGLTGFDIPSLSVAGVVLLDMADENHFYYFAVTVLFGSAYIMRRFIMTPFGTVMTGIRDNPDRIGYLGFEVEISKGIVLLVSAGFAGISGSVYVLFQNMVSIDGVMGPMSSFTPLLSCFIGGLGTFAGPIIGTGFGTVLLEMLADHPEQAQLVFALVLIGMVLFLPGGIMMLLRIMQFQWWPALVRRSR